MNTIDTINYNQKNATTIDIDKEMRLTTKEKIVLTTVLTPVIISIAIVANATIKLLLTTI